MFGRILRPPAWRQNGPILRAVGSARGNSAVKQTDRFSRKRVIPAGHNMHVNRATYDHIALVQEAPVDHLSDSIASQ